MPRLRICCLFLLLPVFALAQPPVKILFKTYPISNAISPDTAVEKMLQPYTAAVDKEMNTVIGFSTSTWYKKQPESALGNFMADAMLAYATKVYQTKVDAAFINYGGIRSYISKGDIKLLSVYQLAPFDNLIVLQTIDTKTLRQLLDLIAYKGGWPCAGLTMKIKNKKAVDVLINGLPLNDTMLYTIAVPDFIAGGGEHCTMLNNIAKKNGNYLYRDALTAYIKSFTAAGKPVSAHLENRIINDDE